MEIKGTVVNKIFESADGYAVVEIEGDEPTVVVGNMPYIKTGELTRFFGEFKMHPKFGRQFSCESYESIQPVEPDDMVRFLASDFVKGLGEVLAQRLVDTFGEETFDVIENHPERVASVKGISLRLAVDLHKTFVEYAQSKNRYAELMGLGLSAKQAAEAAESLGGDGAARIRENPYVLIGAVRGIDFHSADRIAESLGLEQDSPMRIERAVLHTLRKSQNELGYMCVPRSRLIGTLIKNLGISKELADTAILSLCERQEIVLAKYDGTQELVSIASAYETEMQSATMLTRLMWTEAKKADEPPSHLQQIAEDEHLSDEQVCAVRAAWENSVCVITGGPGTGKTTIVKAVLRMFGSAGMKCVLAAPTGRAAKRLQETTGEEAKTIHRMLEFTYDDDTMEPQFRVDEDNPLDADVVIVDEMSMVDAYLFRSLLRGVSPGTRLVMIGDANQLPSVGPGDVLADLVSCGCLPTFVLTKRYRNSGRIAAGAHEVLAGQIPQFDDTELIFVTCPTVEDVVDRVREEYEQAVRADEDVQVIAPVKKKTLLGSIALNAMLREAVNPMTENKEEFQRGDHLYREGDRVMQIVNDYTREWENHASGEWGEGVYNGDIGVIRDITGGEIRVDFEDGRTAVYGREEADSLDGAFAYTVHKAQGSEFESIILPMMYIPNPFLSRSLLYTAITRAKKKVTIIGAPSCFAAMVRNNTSGARMTVLGHELQLLNRTMHPQLAEAR